MSWASEGRLLEDKQKNTSEFNYWLLTKNGRAFIFFKYSYEKDHLNIIPKEYTSVERNMWNTEIDRMIKVILWKISAKLVSLQMQLFVMTITYTYMIFDYSCRRHFNRGVSVGINDRNGQHDQNLLPLDKFPMWIFV